MINHKDHLSRVYSVSGQAETDAFYSDWAETYDAEVIANGYATPERAASALAGQLEKDANLLDVGCGTGYSGEHFFKRGFANLSGCDPNPEMLEIARAREIYRDLWLMRDLSNPFPFEKGHYDVIAAIGVISTGAAPPSTLEDVLRKLSPGGKLIFSYNDHALETPEFPAALEDVLARRLARKTFEEYGPHLTGQNLNSAIYILERL